MITLLTFYYHMNNLFNRLCNEDDSLLTDLNAFAEENELTLDYVISEFCIDDDFIPV